MTTIAARTPIATFQDILDAMAQQPELKTELRRHLQDEDFHNLPQTVAKLADSLQDLIAIVRDISLRQEQTETDIVDLKAGQARLESGQARLEAGQAQHSADIADLKAVQAQHSADIADLKAGQARLEAGQVRLEIGQVRLEAGQAQHSAEIIDLKAVQAELIAKQTSMQGQLNRLAGTDYERKIARNLRRRAYRHFGINDAELTHSVTLPNSNRIPDLLDAAYAQGVITDDEVEQAQVIDIVIGGVTDANLPAYVAIEASVTVGYSDISRARERAAIISRAAGVPVIAGVVGTEIPAAVRQNAADNGVTVVIMLD